MALCLVFGDTSSAQSTLPPVTVDAPKPQAARPTQPSRRAVRSQGGTRRVAAPAPQQNVEPGARGAGGAARERANGPVVGYLASESATATKTDTPILTTPQSISVVTQDQMQAQGAQNVTEALRYTPGVTVQSFGANAFFDSFKLRGFDAPRYLDGLRLPADNTTFAIPRIETYGLERLEVLKGPSSGLYGQSDPGGLHQHGEQAADLDAAIRDCRLVRIFRALSGCVRYRRSDRQERRVSLSHRRPWARQQQQTDFVQDNKLFIAPSFTWRPTNDTSFTILSQYQKADNKGYQQYVPGQVSFLPNPNGHVPYSRYIGDPGFDGYNLEQCRLGYAFEHRFDNNLQFRQNFRYIDVDNDLASRPLRGNGDSVGSTSVTRTYNYVKARARNFALDNQLQADFMTGPLTHKVLVGFDYFNLSANTDYRSPVLRRSTLTVRSIMQQFRRFASLAPFILRDDRLSQAGVYLQDQIKLDRWTLTVSGRQDWASTGFTSKAAFPPLGTYQSRRLRADRPRWPELSVRLRPVALCQLCDSFTPNLGADSAGKSFRPTTGEGNEIGVKFKPNGSNLMVTAALFDIRQNDVLTGDPANLFFNMQTDAARVRGFEFEAQGNVTRELEIVGGVQPSRSAGDHEPRRQCRQIHDEHGARSGARCGQVHLVRRPAGRTWARRRRPLCRRKLRRRRQHLRHSVLYPARCGHQL